MIVSCGYSFKKIKTVYGIAKIYNTYVGAMNYQPDDDKLIKLQKLGEEFGSTTNRKRQCNWLNLDELLRSININSVTDLIINKCDILQQLKFYKLYHNNREVEFKTFEEMKKYIRAAVPNHIHLIFSSNKDSI